MELELSYENFLQYYRSQEFEKGLQNYFKVEGSKNGGGCRFIFRVDKHSSEPHNNHSMKNEHEKSHYFAIVFYYVCLCNYAIQKVAGKDTLINFLESTNWPMVYGENLAFTSPNGILETADLVYKNNSINYKKTLALFHETIPFMKEELNNFFKGGADNLNQAAYDEFVKAMDGKIEKFWEIADKEIESFTFHK